MHIGRKWVAAGLGSRGCDEHGSGVRRNEWSGSKENNVALGFGVQGDPQCSLKLKAKFFFARAGQIGEYGGRW
ncbi:hypothetical protein TorRG33x02_239190 [Trema orientale]|uniref:Uncharacterized protein n=1 Tax=Trema orientale TaxID=63057 RepID=A0A2P5DXQ9_TREOI|nr:hypothetical protein TorRG33x02_239190 [Trema orientale]